MYNTPFCILMLMLFCSTGGHFDVSKEKRPLDIKKVDAF